MIGLFYLFYTTVGLTVGYIKDNISNMRSKKYAEKLYNEGNNRTHIYIDTQGNKRDLTNNHKIFTYRDNNGDVIVKDLKTKHEKNIDKHARNIEYEYKKKNAIQKARDCSSVVLFGKFLEKQYMKSFLFGKDRYIDSNGNIYIKKYMMWNDSTMELNNCNRIGAFYININTYRIDYVELLNVGEIFKHRSTCHPPYKFFNVLYANNEESEKYKEWYNNNETILKNEPLKFCGKFYISEYK